MWTTETSKTVTWVQRINKLITPGHTFLPRSTKGVQHPDNKLMGWHGLHDEALILNVADVCVGSKLHLLQRQKLHLELPQSERFRHIISFTVPRVFNITNAQ